MPIHSWVLVQRGHITRMLVNAGWHVQCLPVEVINDDKYFVFRTRLLRKRPINIEEVKRVLSYEPNTYGFDEGLTEEKTAEKKERNEALIPPRLGTMLTGKEMLLYFKELPRDDSVAPIVRNRYNEGL